MRRYVWPTLKALPVLDPTTFSLRSAISVLLTISEPSPLGETTMKAALDRLSDAELEKLTKPKEITSASEARAYMANTKTQSPEYAWRRNGQYIFLLARSKHAKHLGVPGVVFEFMIRTVASQWTVYQIPDTDNVFEHPAHFYRNELMAYSHRPAKSPIPLKRKHVHGRVHGLGQDFDGQLQVEDRMEKDSMEHMEELRRRLVRMAKDLQLSEEEVTHLREALAAAYDGGVASVYDSVQRLSIDDANFQKKRDILRVIFEHNIEIRKSLT